MIGTLAKPFSPSNAVQLKSDGSYTIAFLIRRLYRKTLYNFVVKISSIKTVVFYFYAVVTVAGFQDISTFLSAERGRIQCVRVRVPFAWHQKMEGAGMA